MAKKPSDMTTKYLLSEKEMPTRWYNIQADFKTPLPPPLHPGTGQPIGPQDLAPLFPMELIKQEVSQERWIEIPDEVRDILRLWRPTPALPRASAREGARYAGAHLLQVRGREPGGQPQAEHGHRAGVLQQAGGRRAPVHRDRRRPVGLGPVAGLQLLRPAVQGLHGQGVLPAEAVPAHPDGDLRRAGRGEPEPGHPGGQEGPRRRIRTRRAASASRSARRSRTRRRATTPSTPSAACSTTCSCTRRSSASRPRSSSRRRTTRPTWSSAASAAARTSRASRSPSPRTSSAARRRSCASWPSSPRACPSLTKGKYVYDFGDTVGLTPARQDAHARPHLHPRAHARGRAPLSRHGPAHLQALRRGRHRGARGAADGDVRGGRPVRARRGDPPRPRGRARRRAAPSTRRCGASRRASARPSCSTSAGTASSISPPTRRTWRASSWTTSTPPRRSRRRSGTCRRSTGSTAGRPRRGHAR